MPRPVKLDTTPLGGLVNPNVDEKIASQERIAMNTIGIFANLQIENAPRIVDELIAWLHARDCHVLFPEHQVESLSQPCTALSSEGVVAEADVLVVLGGDGTLLRTAHIEGIEQVPILAVNLGHLGYFTEVTLNEMYDALQHVFNREFGLDRRMMLSVQLQRCEQRIALGDALNEVLLRGLVHLIRLDTWIDGEFLAHYVVDGLIISTPSGSTAYSLSAGGPVIHPNLDVVVLSPICPFTLAMRPFVASGEAQIRVRPQQGHDDMLLAIDGQESYHLEADDTVCVGRSPKTIQLIRSQHRSYYEVLRGKLNWGQNPGTYTTQPTDDP